VRAARFAGPEQFCDNSTGLKHGTEAWDSDVSLDGRGAFHAAAKTHRKGGARVAGRKAGANGCRKAGARGKDFAGISSDNDCGNQSRRKPKVTCVKIFCAG
jgi:hypothetical protein